MVGDTSPFRNALNTAVMFLVALPALMFTEWAFQTCSTSTPAVDTQRLTDPSYLLSEDCVCAVTIHHPILTVNIIYFFNVNVLFWLISFLYKGSTWLIDPYWTFIPVMIGLFYRNHPLAVYDEDRSRYSLALLLTWAVRLTYSYFRREEWTAGAREDWRFAEMAKTMPRHWWWVRFWAAYVSQQPMLVGLTLPLYAIHSSSQPWNIQEEQIIVTLALAGILTAHMADGQLHQFVSKNQQLQEDGKPTVPILKTGMWRFSRHPNYFGEQLYWLGMGLWSWHLGNKWMIAGTLYNTLIMLKVTQLTENRMVAKPERAELYREYQRTTSMWVPWMSSKKAPAAAASAAPPATDDKAATASPQKPGRGKKRA